MERRKFIAGLFAIICGVFCLPMKKAIKAANPAYIIKPITCEYCDKLLTARFRDVLGRQGMGLMRYSPPHNCLKINLVEGGTIHPAVLSPSDLPLYQCEAFDVCYVVEHKCLYEAHSLFMMPGDPKHWEVKSTKYMDCHRTDVSLAFASETVLDVYKALRSSVP
jgi:hypothetical protein